jgi:hypothetical protein
MQRSLLFSAILFSSLLLTGCPVGLDYGPGTPGTVEVDKKLVGTWVNSSSEGEILKVEIKSKDRYSYDVEILEKGEMYALETTHLQAWITEIGGQPIIYAKPDGEEKYYMYAYKIDKGELKTWDISLTVNGVDGVTSTDALIEEIIGSMQNPEFLSSENNYTKK